MLATLLLSTGPLLAQEVLTPREFEQITEGRNVEYVQDGIVIG